MATDATSQIIVAALGAGGVGAIGAAIITGFFSKRKLGAEAAEIITKAAAGVVTQLERQIERLTKQGEEQQQRHERVVMRIKSDHEAELNDVRAVLQLHVAWDTMALTELAKIGVDLPPVPPLLPPRLQKG